MRKQITGTVISNKMDKTIVVEQQWLKKHGLYKKYIRRATKFYAHDGDNSAALGDKVLIEETRPLSKLKRWRLIRIVEKAPLVEESHHHADVSVASKGVSNQ